MGVGGEVVVGGNVCEAESPARVRLFSSLFSSSLLSMCFLLLSDCVNERTDKKAGAGLPLPTRGPRPLRCAAVAPREYRSPRWFWCAWCCGGAGGGARAGTTRSSG